jgi:YD repeat-containing protein
MKGMRHPGILPRTVTVRRGLTSTFTYDNLNRLVGESYQDAERLRAGYDVLGRLAQVNDSAAGTFAFAYDPANRHTNTSTPFGTVN